MSAPRVAQVRSLTCPNCGGAVELRGLGKTLSAVCPGCLSILDTTTPSVEILQKFEERARIQPGIALGTRGKWDGTLYEVTGFLERALYADGERYAWREYLLFNPFKGFRYLTEYNGHWNDVKVLKPIPEPVLASGGERNMRLQGVEYRHFQTYSARVEYVLGEFPWRVRVGDTAEMRDYVNPPRMISSETTEAEVTWSVGDYIPGATVWQNFRLAGYPPPATGVYADQPAPNQGAAGRLWGLCLAFLIATFALSVFFSIATRKELVHQGNYSYTPRQKAEGAFVTPVFELKGHVSNVEIRTRTDLENNWAYFNFALLNRDTGQVWEFGRELSYYRGTDSDGSWSEGGSADTVRVPSIPAGYYYLRVEPEMDPAAPREVNYSLEVRRDVPSYTFIWVAALLLLIPPVFALFRGSSFETARWQESDHPRLVGTPGSGDDD
jgi:hypothetical protein